MLRTITAIEREGMDVLSLTMVFEVANTEFDLIAAAMAAATDDCKTAEGCEIFSRNRESFNWADLDMYVPNKICEKHGFKKVDSCLSEVVDWNGQLVDESQNLDNNEL